MMRFMVNNVPIPQENVTPALAVRQFSVTHNLSGGGDLLYGLKNVITPPPLTGTEDGLTIFPFGIGTLFTLDLKLIYDVFLSTHTATHKRGYL